MQPSLFGVEATDPVPADLAGLLAGPGELHRLGGTARIRVRVDAGWRVHALLAEFAVRALSASWQPVGDSGAFEVRTAYTTRLVGLVRQWRAGPPAGLHLHGQLLRLWVAAAGALDADGCLLRLGPRDQPAVSALGAALSAVGLAAALVVPGAAGASPSYRITGRRRLIHLANLIGPAPAAAPDGVWPVGPLHPTNRS